MTRRLALGLDFGTESVRALLLDVDRAEDVGSHAVPYRHGVLQSQLPTGEPLGADWALQSPADWLESLQQAVRELLHATAADPAEVLGVGIGFTSCTILPTAADGTPLCLLDAGSREPNAWPKLWKHHAAQAQADELTALAETRAERWLARYGGRVSSEWLLPKAMQILDESPETFAAAELILEAGDWVAWQLTGELARNACAAGFKALWHKRDGYPDDAFLAALRPQLAGFFAGRGAGEVRAPGEPVGTLAPAWARRLGLPETVVVAVGIVDAHAGLLGAGVGEAGTLYMATGTSTCHLLLAEAEHAVRGISGVVEDGIVAGAYAYEAGQASVGDTFDWYARLVDRPHAQLTVAAAGLQPGASGLLALDWWNGCRTPLVDADLSGAILGTTLSTPSEAVYRALLEATAFGTRLVLDTFAAGGIAVDGIVAGGGLTANALLLQIYADVTSREVAVVASEQPSARGAAILGAAAAGVFASVAEAVGATAAPSALVVEPHPHPAYDELYGLYRELVSTLGEAGSPLKRLAAIRRAADPVPVHS